MRRFWDIVRLDIPDAAAAIPKMVIKFSNADVSLAATTSALIGGYDNYVCLFFNARLSSKMRDRQSR
jgi:hypothetical protein